MLAYTPLHLLLFEYFKGSLVATSANLSGESIIKDEFNLCKNLIKFLIFIWIMIGKLSMQVMTA